MISLGFRISTSNLVNDEKTLGIGLTLIMGRLYCLLIFSIFGILQFNLSCLNAIYDLYFLYFFDQHRARN